VVAFEDCERVGEGAAERVRVARPVAPRENVRAAGADLAAGATALDAGRELSPHDLALAAALGGGTLVVGRRPRVAIVLDRRRAARRRRSAPPRRDPGQQRAAASRSGRGGRESWS